MRSFLFIWAILILSFHYLNAQTPQLLPGWPFISRADSVSNFQVPALVNMDNPESLGIFYGTNTREIYRFHLDARVWTGWPFEDRRYYFGRDLLIPVDIDHDGKFEVAAMGIDRQVDGHIFLIDDDGLLMPGFPFDTRGPDALNVSDFDNDGEYEIMSYSRDDGLIFCIDRLGQSKEGWPKALPYDMYFNERASVGDIDLDGYLEFIFLGDDHIYAFSFDGSQPAGYPITIPDTLYSYFNGWHPPTLGDIDQDGYLELIAAWDDWHAGDPFFTTFVAIFEHTGEIKEGWPITHANGYVTGSPTIGDINNDGQMEICLAYHSTMTCLDLQGRPLPGWPIQRRTPEGYSSQIQSDPVLVDIDGDRDLEIFTDSDWLFADSVVDSIVFWGYGWLYGYDHTGQLLPSYPFEINGDMFFCPPSFYLDPITNRLYMGLTSRMNLLDMFNVDTTFLEIYVLPDSTGPANQWPMRGHDNFLSRNFDFVDRVTAVKDLPPPLPYSPILSQNYPNPFNGQTVVKFSLPSRGQISLLVYDITGRKVCSLADGILDRGEYSLPIDLGGKASGTYFYRLATENLTIIRKMLLLK